jgi:hypothetical protein
MMDLLRRLYKESAHEPVAAEDAEAMLPMHR